MKFATISSFQTAYYASGSGERNLLFIHGWASSGRMWLRSMCALRREYRMWAVDLPGCGDSDAPDIGWYSIENYADHIAAFCHFHGIDHCAVIGHSIGGRIAFELARRHAYLVERVVAVSPLVTGRLGFYLDVLLLAGLIGRKLRLPRRVWPLAARSSLNEFWAPGYLEPQVVQRTTHDLRRTSPEAAIGTLRALIRQDYSPHLAHIHHPTLLICGERDDVIPPADSRLAAQRLPRAQLVMLAQVHHQPTDEAHEVVIQTVREFLANGHREKV